MERIQLTYDKPQSFNVFLMKKTKSRVKNIFIQKVNSSVSLEETRKVAQKQNECGHLLKQFSKVLMKT